METELLGAGMVSRVKYTGVETEHDRQRRALSSHRLLSGLALRRPYPCGLALRHLYPHFEFLVCLLVGPEHGLAHETSRPLGGHQTKDPLSKLAHFLNYFI